MSKNGASPKRAARRFDSAFCATHARRRVLASAVLASALGFIDGTLVSIAIPAMRETLGATLTEAQWISNAYMLTLSALILAGGAIGDRYGLARAFGAGIILFMAASLGSALAPTPEILIAMRALKGVGAALMVPGSLALIYRTYPPDERGRAIGIWAAASAMTTALGPIIGGVAITLAGPETWRWLFAINLPLGAVALWLLASAVDTDRATEGARIDGIGAALTALGLGALAWAMTGAGDLAWPLAIAGAVALLTFLLWEARTGHPMMPLGLFANRTFSAANIVTLCLYFTLSAILFYLPMTVIAGWGETEAIASAAFVPMTVLIALLSTPVGKLADRIGARPLIAGGSALVAVGYAVLALTTPLHAFWSAVIPAMCVMGLGMALVVAPLSAAVMGSAPETLSGVASGVNNAVSRVAGLMAVAAMGAVAAQTYAAAGGPDSFGVSSELAQHARATDAAFARIAWIAAGLAMVSSLIALFAMPRRVADQIG